MHAMSMDGIALGQLISVQCVPHHALNVMVLHRHSVQHALLRMY